MLSLLSARMAIALLSYLSVPFFIFHVYQAAPIRREIKRKAILVISLLSFAAPIFSLLLALSIRAFIAEARYIPAGSMEPSLQINDRLVIDKLTYHFSNPQRGDIVVFNPTPILRQQGFNDAFIKRIIGLPGEQVEIKDGSVLINQKPLQEPYVANGDDTIVDLCNFSDESEVEVFLEEPQTIPAGQYLVLGDNRHNSYDGRCWGLISRSDIIGQASQRFWPPHRLGPVQPKSPK